jgi:hypothetical protein
MFPLIFKQNQLILFTGGRSRIRTWDLGIISAAL